MQYGKYTENVIFMGKIDFFLKVNERENSELCLYYIIEKTLAEI